MRHGGGCVSGCLTSALLLCIHHVVTQRQDPTSASSQTSGVLVLRTFHVDHEKWDRFGEVARAKDSSRAAELRGLIDHALEQGEAA
jgi:hypothetical protein